MKHINFKKAIMLAGMLATAGAHADNIFSVSGFGYQDYRQTNANVQDGADNRGTWDNDILAFVISAKVDDRDTVFAQLESTATEPTALTWGFLDHQFSNTLSARVGRVKLPMGLYNEYVDNKWLQLGVIQPSIYAPAADLVSDAYSGVGVDWTTGSLFTQVYAGNTYINPAVTPPEDTFPDGVSPHEHRRLFGARITWNTPYEGLRFLVSANEGQIETIAVTGYNVPTPGQLGHETRTILSLDYVSDRLDIKAEYATHKIQSFPGSNAALIPFYGPTSNAWYVQGGYKIGVWTPYVRYDNYTGDQSNTSDPSLYQKDQVVGVGYKITDSVNARIEFHSVKGCGLTEDVALGIACTTDWNQVAAGINFVF